MAFVISSAVLLASCGKSDVPPPVVGVPGTQVGANVLCPGGQIGLGNVCYPTPDLATACWYAGGTMTTVSGKAVCRRLSGLPPGYSASIYNAKLNPSNLAGPSAYPTNVFVEPNDKLTYTGSGSWGSVSADTNTYLGFLDITTFDYDCDSVSISGVNLVDSTPVTHEGVPAALAMSNGTEFVVLGASKVHTFTSSGAIRIGFNVPVGWSNCSSATISQFLVQHCEDAAGTNYVCP